MFEPIVIEFKGEEFKVPANQVFGLIATIENYITLADLHGSPKNTALAEAYAAAVRYAGGNATKSEVYEMLFDMTGPQNIRSAIGSLMAMMIPPSAMKKAKEEDGAEQGEKKPQA